MLPGLPRPKTTTGSDELESLTPRIIAALFALAAKDTNDVYFLIAYFPPSHPLAR